MKPSARFAALALALAPLLAGCTPGPADDGRPLAEAAAGPGDRVDLPPGAHPLALRAAVTGLAPANGEAPRPPVLRLFDTRRSQKLALPMRADGVAIYGLRPGYYKVDRVAGYACGTIGFAVGSRDGVVALGNWTLSVDPSNPKKATLKVTPLGAVERRAVGALLSTPDAMAREAIHPGPWNVGCGLGKDDRFGGRSAGEVAALSVLGVAGAAAGLATGNPTVMIMIGGL